MTKKITIGDVEIDYGPPIKVTRGDEFVFLHREHDVRWDRVFIALAEALKND